MSLERQQVSTPDQQLDAAVLLMQLRLMPKTEAAAADWIERHAHSYRELIESDAALRMQIATDPSAAEKIIRDRLGL